MFLFISLPYLFAILYLWLSMPQKILFIYEFASLDGNICSKSLLFVNHHLGIIMELLILGIGFQLLEDLIMVIHQVLWKLKHLPIILYFSSINLVCLFSSTNLSCVTFVTKAKCISWHDLPPGFVFVCLLIFGQLHFHCIFYFYQYAFESIIALPSISLFYFNG